MPKAYLKVPNIQELHYRQEWMKNPKTMSYNAGYDMDLKGYDKTTGTITKTDEEMITWYNNWINKEPDKYFAYIYDNDIEEPIGEVYYYLNNGTYSMGILIQDKYRGKGYSYEALLELEKIAFEKNNICELSDIIPLDRIGAIKSFKKAGFKHTELKKKELVFGKESITRQFIITKEMYKESGKMIRYYCSGFDVNNAFGHGLGEMFKNELKNTKSIVYIPGSPEKTDKAKTKYVPAFTTHFKNVGIEFENVNIITPDITSDEAKKMIKEASFVMLMGGDPFKQKQICENTDIMEELKSFNGVMMGFSAGAMLMSKYIIITPCSEEYPEFRIENGLNFDELSIYPHNNTSDVEYPEILIVGDEIYKREDLLKVAKKCGKFYLLQDNLNTDGLTDISIIKSINGDIEFYTENNGKIWSVEDNISLINVKTNTKTM